MIVSRRDFMLGAAAFIAVTPTLLHASELSDQLAQLEKQYGGRLGVAIIDTGSGTQFTHRADERFGLCSTFKFLAAAAVLHRIDQGLEQLDRQVLYTKADLIEYAPITEQHVNEGSMALGDLCAAAVELSDNTAGNLLLRTLGGPQGLTKFMRDLGDDITRMDRMEPTLNIIEPGDPRDTTTPASMLKLMKKLLVEEALHTSSRKQLQQWMINCKTGTKRVAAGLPADWLIGDKTGTGPKGEANDVAIIWPPERKPVLVASYYVGEKNTPEERNAVHAAIGRLVIENT